MKRIFFIIIALMATLTISAQTIKVYKYNADGSLKSTPVYTSSEKVKVVFDNSSSNYGDNVEGSMTIEGQIYTRTVGGTIGTPVDLGLPSGTLWADHNLGANVPSDYGAWITWGELGALEEGYINGVKIKDNKSCYKFINDKYCQTSNMEGYLNSYYNESDMKLREQDDAATFNWGENWKIPTVAQCAELCNTKFTTCTWYPKGNTEFNGIEGIKIQSLMSGYTDRYIFIPAAGSRNDFEICELGEYVYFWTNATNYPNRVSPNAAYVYAKDNGYIGLSFGALRCAGMSIRPVFVK